jgi:hypothetical protein
MGEETCYTILIEEHAMIKKLGMMVCVMVMMISLVGCDTATVDMSAVSESLAAANNELAETISDLKAAVIALGD